MLDSPYTPSFGVTPPVLVGREAQLRRADRVLTRSLNDQQPAPSVLAFHGPRGVGKTVLLNQIASMARQRGVLAVGVTLDSASNNPQFLAAKIAEAVAPLHNKTIAGTWERLRARLSNLDIEINAGLVKVGAKGRSDDASNNVVNQRAQLTDVITDAAAIARDAGRTGLILTIDELPEPRKDDLVVIANAFQDVLGNQDVGSVAVFGAGLPSTPKKVMDACTFTERFQFRTVTAFDPEDAELALLEPALAKGVRWDRAAANLVLERANGSPFLIQQLGDEAWMNRAPSAGDTIDLASTRAAVDDVETGLAEGMHPGRWEKCTDRERAYLAAMAQVVNDAGEARTGDIAAVLRTSSTSLSQYREQLRQKSIITDVRHGVVGFTMPGFDRFVRDVTELPRLRKADLDVLRATGLKAPPLPSPAADPDRLTSHSPRGIARSPTTDLER